MSDRLGMILAIHEQPDDDLPRLAYADWLEERGELEHAEFIRVELALARTSRRADAYRPLFLRELELIRAHKDEWFGTFRTNWNNYDIRRGFIDEVSAPSPESFVPHADWLFDHHALQDLRVAGSLEELLPLLVHPLMGILGRLSLSGVEPGTWSYFLSSEVFQRDVPLSRRPLILSLAGHWAGPELIDALLDSPCIHRVCWLNLSLNALGPVGMRRLLDGLSAMPRLTTLLLAGYRQGQTCTPNIDRGGVLELANHPATAQLERIDLDSNNIRGDLIRVLIDSPHLGGVKKLRIGQELNRAGCRRLREHFGDRVVLPGTE
jgi:uncharacterized protein (TIGR02996 family)